MIDSPTLLFFSAKTDRGVGGSLTPSDRTPTMEESYTPICLNAFLHTRRFNILRRTGRWVKTKSTENHLIFSALRRFAIFDCDPGGACHYIFMSVIIKHLHLTIFGQFPIFTPSEFHDFLRFQNRSK